MKIEVPKIFLCYAKEDAKIVESIFLKLRNSGFKPWMDKPPKPYAHFGIKPGEKWDRAIRTAIRGCDYFIAFLSKKSVTKSGYVQREYRLALDILNELPPNRTFLLPVLIENCDVPDLKVGTESFHDFQWYLLYEKGIDELIEFISSDHKKNNNKSCLNLPSSKYWNIKSDNYLEPLNNYYLEIKNNIGIEIEIRNATSSFLENYYRSSSNFCYVLLHILHVDSKLDKPPEEIAKNNVFIDKLISRRIALAIRFLYNLPLIYSYDVLRFREIVYDGEGIKKFTYIELNEYFDSNIALRVNRKTLEFYDFPLKYIMKKEFRKCKNLLIEEIIWLEDYMANRKFSELSHIFPFVFY